jgi:hypothetical protein
MQMDINHTREGIGEGDQPAERAWSKEEEANCY